MHTIFLLAQSAPKPAAPTSQLPAAGMPAPASWPLVSPEERRLLEAAAAGDQRACSILVRRYRSAAYAIALRLSGHAADADEITQDAFLRAFRYIGNFRGESSFKTWLLRITGRVAIDHLRRKKLETVSLDAPESPVARMAEKGPGGLQHLIRDERSAMLLEAMEQLCKEDASALRLFYLHEKSIQEITGIMGWTESNTKSRLSRARQRLRVVIEGKYAEELAE